VRCREAKADEQHIVGEPPALSRLVLPSMASDQATNTISGLTPTARRLTVIGDNRNVLLHRRIGVGEIIAKVHAATLCSR